MKASMMRTAAAAGVLALTASAHAGSFTDFEAFSLGSVDGQGGWSATGGWDEAVVDDGGNKVWRISNAVTAGSFGDMPFSPRAGGVPSDTVNDPVNSLPDEFAGETQTGATHNQFIAGFRFKSATGATQAGMSVTISADNGSGGRHGFIDIEESALNGSGLDIVTFDVDSSGDFQPAATIASGLSYTDWHEFRLEIDFVDGADNDVVRYYVNNTLVHTATSWEEFYPAQQPGSHPLGVPVQSLIFRVSGGAVPAVNGGGLYIDDVSTQTVPEPSSLVLLGLAGAGLVSRRRRA